MGRWCNGSITASKPAGQGSIPWRPVLNLENKMSNEILKKLEQMSPKQRAKFYHTVLCDKDVLILAAIEKFSIHFELAEHIVELAVGHKNFTKLSLAKASILICKTAKSVIGE